MRLANRTSQATDAIGARITAIQAETVQAVEAIRGIGATINRIDVMVAAVMAEFSERCAAAGQMPWRRRFPVSSLISADRMLTRWLVGRAGLFSDRPTRLIHKSHFQFNFMASQMAKCALFYRLAKLDSLAMPVSPM